MTQDLKVPKLRFPGFSGEWEEKKLKELVDVYDGVHQTPDYKESGVMFLSVENISTLKSNKYISEEAFQKNYKVFPEKGDILMTRIGDIGTPHIVETSEKLAYYVSLALLKLKSLYPYFLNYALQSPSTQYSIKKHSLSTAIPMKINKEEIGEVDTFISLHNDEQAKIGSFFANLDSTITHQQRKLEFLKKLKKALLQKMFPKKGKSVPELRFPGFNGEWKENSFADLGTVSMCKRVLKEQTSSDGDVPFYKIGTFGGEPDAYVSRELFTEYKSKFSYPEIGDMLISASGTIGRIVEYTGKDEYFQDSNIVWFKHDQRIANSFLKCLYSTVKWNGIEGSTIKRLYNDNFLKTVFMMPSVEEQQKIGSFFANLDSTITQQQRKLNSLKKLKKGLLQQMFV